MFKNILIRNGGGGQVGKSTYAIRGVLVCLPVRTMGEGVKFLSFLLYILIE